MKLSNDIKLKLDVLLNKTGLVIDLVEKETQLEGQYIYQLRVNLDNPYISGGNNLNFKKELWDELYSILNEYNITFLYRNFNNCFIPFKNETKERGRYIGGMDFHDSVTSNQVYVIIGMTNNKVLVLNDYGGTSWLMKDKFRIQ